MGGVTCLVISIVSLVWGGMHLGWGDWYVAPFLCVFLAPSLYEETLLRGYKETARIHVDDAWYVFTYRAVLFCILCVFYIPWILVSDVAKDSWEYLEETFSPNL